MAAHPHLKEEVRSRCAEMGIPMVGFATADRWDRPPFEPWVPEEFRPKSIFPETKSVIVLGLPITLPIVETTPSIAYHTLYETANRMLDQSAYALSNYLNAKGHASIFIPRDGYGHLSVLRERPIAFFSHRHAAYLAGLGTFGVNNVLLTREYGPRVRFGAVFTAAGIEPDPLMEGDLCTRCMRCVDACPAKALSGQDYPGGLVDKEACTAENLKLIEDYIHPCGICIKVCPVGEDRKLFRREDATIYESEEGHEELSRAWKHVRSYGGRVRKR